MKNQRRKIGFVLISVILLGIIGLSTQKEMDATFLDKELLELKSYLKFKDSLNTKVSEASVAWHLDHILLVVTKVYKQMDTSDVSKYKNKFNFSRTMVFTFNKIPRGRGESPKSVRPSNKVLLDSIVFHLSEAKKLVARFDSLNRKSHFKHPYFGKLNRRQTKKFLKIHTNHHLDIIKDILKE